MSEQVSKELLKIMNSISENEATIAKIDGGIFVRNNQKLINEKVAYLYNMINVEAKNCKQNQNSYFDKINLMITHYKQKLNMVYDELYCQYVNIQSELQDANINRRIAIINYQKIVNKLENTNPLENDLKLKEEYRNKNNIYISIVNKCKNKFKELDETFGKMIDEKFSITSKSLEMISEQNFIQKLIYNLSNIFSGKKRFEEILKRYEKQIDNIDSYEISQDMREDIINFVTEIIEIKGINENELQEDVRVGGKNV